MTGVFRAVERIQNRITKALNNRKGDIEPPSSDDMIATIVQDQYLWNKFRDELKMNYIVTNMAAEEYLFIFLAENKKDIEARLMSKKMQGA